MGCRTSVTISLRLILAVRTRNEAVIPNRFQSLASLQHNVFLSFPKFIKSHLFAGEPFARSYFSIK